MLHWRKQVKTRSLPSSEQPHQLAQCLPSPPYPNLETTEKSEWHYKDDNHIISDVKHSTNKSLQEKLKVTVHSSS